MAHKQTDVANLDACARLIRAAGKRLAGYDPDQLPRLQALHRAVDDAMVTAVRGMRAQGITWVSIANELGVTKEAVVQRYGPSRHQVSTNNPRS